MSRMATMSHGGAGIARRTLQIHWHDTLGNANCCQTRNGWRLREAFEQLLPHAQVRFLAGQEVRLHHHETAPQGPAVASVMEGVRRLRDRGSSVLVAIENVRLATEEELLSSKAVRSRASRSSSRTVVRAAPRQTMRRSSVAACGTSPRNSGDPADPPTTDQWE